jgi:hypothetical protein
MRKFSNGTEVRATIRSSDNSSYEFDGVVESYDESEGGYWVRTTFRTTADLSSYIPLTFARRLFAFPDGKYWKVLRVGRQLELSVYDDGLDNWI